MKTWLGAFVSQEQIYERKLIFFRFTAAERIKKPFKKTNELLLFREMKYSNPL